jgi:uncharacterized protein YjdB
VISVDTAGVVTVLAGGTVTLTATSEGKSGRTTVVVHPGSVQVASIVFTPDSIALRPGETLRLEAVVYDSTGAELEDRLVTWSADPAWTP